MRRRMRRWRTLLYLSSSSPSPLRSNASLEIDTERCLTAGSQYRASRDCDWWSMVLVDGVVDAEEQGVVGSAHGGFSLLLGLYFQPAFREMYIHILSRDQLKIPAWINMEKEL